MILSLNFKAIFEQICSYLDLKNLLPVINGVLLIIMFLYEEEINLEFAVFSVLLENAGGNVCIRRKVILKVILVFLYTGNLEECIAKWKRLPRHWFLLWVSLCFMFHVPALLVENGKFLLSAKRTRRTTCTEYVISMDADNISRSSSTYIGKLR